MTLLSTTDNIAGVFLSCVEEREKLEEGSFARIIPVISPIERMGKSILISNVAVELVRMGRRVVILNLARGLRDVYYLLDVRPINKIPSSNGIEVLEASYGIKLLPQDLGIRSVTNLSNEQRDILINDLARILSSTDVMLVDTPMKMDSNMTMIMKLSREVIVLTSPDLNVMMDSYRLIKAISQLNGDITIKLVINKVKNAKEAKRVYKKISTVTKRFLNKKIKSYSFVLRDLLVNQSIFKRVPFVISEPKSHPARCIRHIAQLLSNNKDGSYKWLK